MKNYFTTQNELTEAVLHCNTPDLRLALCVLMIVADIPEPNQW